MNRKIKVLRNLGQAVLALGFATAAGAQIAGAQTLKLPPHEKVVLKNGLTLLLMEKHGVPMIDLAAIVKAGSVADPAGEEGLAAVTAGLLHHEQAARRSGRASPDLSPPPPKSYRQDEW